MVIWRQSDDGHNLIITGGLGFDCSFWVSPTKHCFGNCGWWSICDDNDYSRGDVEMMILNDFTIYEHAIRQL